MDKPPLKPSRKLDSNSDYAKYWTGLPEWVKLNDALILKVPPQYGHFWELQNHPKIKFTHSIARPAYIRQIDFIAFSMFLPDFSGYTPDNYLTEFSEDEVKVVSIQPRPMSYAEPDAPGTYPPNMFKRASDGGFDINKYEEKYGLRCYDQKNLPEGIGSSQYCYGIRDDKLGEYILLEINTPPYPDWVRYPMMKTTYFTKQYGGLEITWWTHAKNFSLWREIDQQIWQHIADWNVAN